MMETFNLVQESNNNSFNDTEIFEYKKPGVSHLKIDEHDHKSQQNMIAENINAADAMCQPNLIRIPDKELQQCKHDELYPRIDQIDQNKEHNNTTEHNNVTDAIEHCKPEVSDDIEEDTDHTNIEENNEKYEGLKHLETELNKKSNKIDKKEQTEINKNVHEHNEINYDLHKKEDKMKDNYKEDENKANETIDNVFEKPAKELRRFSLGHSECFRNKLSFRDNTQKWLRFSLGNEEDVENKLAEWSGQNAVIANLEEVRNNREPEAEISRSQYSLVSSRDVTSGAVQLWLGLPEEVKYDPALAPFRQYYEKEHGKQELNKSSSSRRRLPSVNSAPHLNNNVHVVRDNPFCEKKEMESEEKAEKFLEEQTNIHCKKSKIAKAKYYVKMTLLLAVWVFFTLAFLMYDEKEHIVRHSFIAPGEIKSYLLSSGGDQLGVLFKISGPLLSKDDESKLNDTELAEANKVVVWMERRNDSEDVLQKTDPWTIAMESKNLDFSRAEPRVKTLRLESYPDSNRTSFVMKMKTNFNETTPFTMSYTLDPLDINTGVIYACVLLCGLYALIIFEVINRTMAAILVATTALATLAIVGERPSLPEIISWLDMETLLLLFSMMLLVAIMAETGLFDFLAVFTFEVTKGKLWPLTTVLCAITAFVSTFLDNVTTVLLMTPVTIRLCEVMDLNPIPVLMSMVLFSNIGGTATPVGDPPNLIIASNKEVIQAGINFSNFTLHMSLGILLVCVQTYVQLRLMFRDTNKLRLNEPRDIQDLRHQISIWRRAAESLPHMSRDEHVVRERLERKVKKLSSQLEILVKESNKRACPKDSFRSTLAEMKETYKIRDKSLLIKSCVAIGFVVALFFLHSIPELNRVSLGWTALLGAILLLTLADREDLEPILHRVEWSTLLFFAALFVLMEALSKLGLIEFIGDLTEAVIMSVDEGSRLAVAILLMLWVSGITSAFVDNIPLTTMMVRIVTSLGTNPTLNLPMTPLIWALSFGACLGGNGTLIGASANVVCAGVSEQHGYKFSFIEFFKIGFPVMIGHLIVASGYLLLCHCVFTWH